MSEHGPEFRDSAPSGREFPAPGLSLFSRPERTRGPLLAGAFLAVCLHLGLLFGLSAGKPEILPPATIESQSVEINLETLPKLQAAAAPIPQPRPVPPPPPVPEPDPVPEPAPVPTPKPDPIPKPVPAPRPAPVPAPGPAATAETAVAALAGPRPGATGETSATSAPPAPAAPSVSPKALDNPKPPYPDLARRRGQEGGVLLRVAVDAQGKVTQTRVETSSGHSLLDQAAQNAVRKWNFSPARVAGLPVAGEVLVPVEFRLN